MDPAGCHVATDKTKVTTPSLKKGGYGSSTEMNSEVQKTNTFHPIFPIKSVRTEVLSDTNEQSEMSGEST